MGGLLFQVEAIFDGDEPFFFRSPKTVNTVLQSNCEIGDAVPSVSPGEEGRIDLR